MTNHTVEHHDLLGESRRDSARLPEVQRAFADPLQRFELLRRLRRWLGFLPFDPSHMGADELATAALPWVDHLLTARAPRAVVGVGEAAPRSSAAAPPRGKAEPPTTSRRTWIAIELQDELGRPCVGEAWRIQLADGSEQSGWLDDAGRATVHGIEPGTCQVCFPELDQREWHAV